MAAAIHRFARQTDQLLKEAGSVRRDVASWTHPTPPAGRESRRARARIRGARPGAALAPAHAAHAVLLCGPAAGAGAVRLCPGDPDRLQRAAQLPQMGSDQPVQAVHRPRQLHQPGAGRQLHPRPREHGDLRGRDRGDQHHPGAAAGAVPQSEKPALAAVPDDLLFAVHHPARADVDRVEMDLRLQLRRVQLRAVAGRHSRRSLAHRSERRAVGSDHHERLAGARLQHDPVPGRHPQHPGRPISKRRAWTAPPPGSVSGTSCCRCCGRSCSMCW